MRRLLYRYLRIISFQKKKKKGETIFICLKYKLIFIFTLWNEVDTIQLTQLARIILYFISNLRGLSKESSKKLQKNTWN